MNDSNEIKDGVLFCEFMEATKRIGLRSILIGPWWYVTNERAVLRVGGANAGKEVWELVCHNDINMPVIINCNPKRAFDLAIENAMSVGHIPMTFEEWWGGPI